MKTWKIRRLAFLLSVLLSAILAASVYMVCREIHLQQKEKEAFAELASRIEQMETVPLTPETGTESSAEESDTQTEVTTKTLISSRNLTPLFEQNEDCIGWLYIEGTTVNYPVMHTPGEPQKYLRKNFDKEYSAAGVPFLDGRSSMDAGNLIIYGHNRKDGSMFADLKKYLDAEFRKEHPVIELETAESIRVYQVTEVRITDITDTWYQTIGKGLFENGRYLTLSTCYGSSKSGRLLIIAVEETRAYKDQS